ncbi:hypothetical protein FI667_g10010, partial [Globisporangium splendens]
MLLGNTKGTYLQKKVHASPFAFIVNFGVPVHVYAVQSPYGAPWFLSYWWLVLNTAKACLPATRVLCEHSAAWIALLVFWAEERDEGSVNNSMHHNTQSVRLAFASRRDHWSLALRVALAGGQGRFHQRGAGEEKESTDEAPAAGQVLCLWSLPSKWHEELIASTVHPRWDLIRDSSWFCATTGVPQ